jgi:hypothetical protein
MWYMPYLRVRRAVIVYACIAAGLTLVAVALRYWPGAFTSGMHDAGDSAHLGLSMLLAGSAALVGGLATVLGLNLASENDGHLELAWTKPVSREGYALGVFAVDIAAIVVCIAVTAVCGATIADVYAGRQIVDVDSGRRLAEALEFCGFPLLVYAWITALSASIKRNRGAVAGLFWPVMFVAVLLPHATYPPLATVAPLFGAFDLLNPLELFTASRGAPPEPLLGPYAWGWFVAAVLFGIALVQWRRLQL